MKAFTMIIIFLFFIMYLVSAAACVAFFYRHDNGQHIGWSRSQKTVSPQKSMNNELIKGKPAVLIPELA